MRAKNTTPHQMQAALEKINVKYKDNIIFKRLEPVGRTVHFTLTVRDSAGPGGRRGNHNNRRVRAACWHVHGDFFESLLELCPEAIIYTRSYIEKPGSRGGKSHLYRGGDIGAKITKDDGNWQDWNAGSQVYPRAMSDMCDCALDHKTREQETGDWIGLNNIKVREIKQSSLTAECWLIQIYGPEHCRTCPAVDTDDCGGQDIRKRLFNRKGLNVPVDYKPDSSTNN